MVTPTIFFQKNSVPNSGEIISNWAAEKGVEIIDPSSATSAAEFVKLANEHQPYAIINSMGLKNVGGWSDELVTGLPSSVKAVCNFSAGYDNMGDLDRYRKKNIQVSNTPKGVAQATADTGLYLLLGALRNFGGLANNLRDGNFANGVPLADEYDNKTLGIVGLGGIGSLLRDKIVGCFDFAKIQYHNRRRAAPDVEKGATYVSAEELIATSDVILLIVPLNSGTYHFLNKETLSKTKKGVVIVNIGRGPLIDEEALAEALESKQVGGVGLDVYEFEPKIHPKLLESGNALLLPHVGTHTTVARNKMLKEVVENLDSVLTNGKVTTPVPELSDL